MTLPKITNLSLNLTDECNLRCRYCFHTKNPHVMSLDTAKRAIDFVVENAKESDVMPYICYFGGEPMLEWNSIIVPATQYAREKYGNNIGFSITTNGTLINDERAAFLCGNKISVLLSADGGRKTQTYNRPTCTGTSSYDAMAKGAQTILSVYPWCRIRMTTIPETAENLFSDLCDMNRLGFQRMSLFPDAGANWDEKAMQVAELEMRKYSEYVVDMYRRGEKPYTVDNMVRCAKQIFIQKYGDREDMSVSPMSRCGTGCSSSAGADYLGNLYLCHRFTSVDNAADFLIGNVFSGEDDEKRSAIAIRILETQIQSSNCTRCNLSKTCDGLCTAENYNHSETFLGVSPVSCWWNRLMAQECLFIINTLGDEHNESFRQTFRDLVMGSEVWT